MSDFASLLSQLDQSAKRPAVQSATELPKKENDSRKRPKKSKISRYEGDSRKRARTKPADLSIQLSFLCIGAQKAGTSWLHEMLCQIPSLGLPPQKEVHFFDWHRNKGFGWYSRQFPRPTTGDALFYGEITPCYMTLSEEDVCEIHHLFPDLKIVFIARDLVDRAWSALTMELRNNVQGLTAGQFVSNRNSQQLDITAQNRIDKESDPNQQTDEYFVNRLKHSTHSQRSDYAAGLRRWLQHFSSEQILILNYEEVSYDPKGFMRQVLRHIGVKQECADKLTLKDLQQKFNVATKPRPIRPSLRKEMEAYLQPMAKEFNRLLKELGYDWKLDEYSSA